MLRRMMELASAAGAAQVIGSIGAVVVALAGIGAGVWSTSRTLAESRDNRLWSHRADVYVELVRRVQRERSVDLEETLRTMSTLDAMPDVHWQSERDRDPSAWRNLEVQVLTYASDETRQLYEAWDHALLRLAGVVQPPRVTGVARADGSARTVSKAIDDVVATGDQLIGQIRAELRSGGAVDGRRRLLWWHSVGRTG
jgi:hypothetical protein